MSLDPIPVATQAPPQSSSGKNWLMLGAAFLAGGVLMCPCGIGAGWLMTKGASAPGKDGVKDPPIVVNEEKGWTWQNLQDHLASKGMKTRRGQGKNGMWYMPWPPDGAKWDPAIDQESIATIAKSPLASFQVKNLEEQIKFGGPAFYDDNFVVIDLGSATAARKRSAEIKDADQRETLAWIRFLFEGQPATLAKLKRLLP